MNDGPRVLVLARAGGQDPEDRITQSLARQTWRGAQLLLVGPGDPATACSPSALAGRLRASDADYLFFWPEQGELRETAIETLVLALHLAPDQHGVTDLSRGLDGLLLLRRNELTLSFADRWLEQRTPWAAEAQRRQLGLFFIDESLTHNREIAFADAGPVGGVFQPLAIVSGHIHYESVTEGPLWPLPAETPDPRHVLFLVSCLPLGGSSKFLLDLVGQLTAAGHRVTVVTTADEPNPWLGELLKLIPDVFSLSHIRPVEIPRLILHLARTRRCGRVVLSDSLIGYQLLPLLRAELPDVSFLDYIHVDWPDGWFALRSTHYNSLLDVTLVSSAHLRRWMIERGADGDKIQVCHTNIDAEKWKPDAAVRARERAGLGVTDEKTAVILYPCRIAVQKRPELLCNIVAALHRATSAPFLVVVAGSGSLLPALRKFVEQHGLTEHVLVLGAVPLERIARLHDAADIFLLPSLSEGIALALFEAMALESVPVVSDVGGQRELVTPDCGHLIPVGEPADEIPRYVSALKSLIEDPARRRRLALAGRARVQNEFPLTGMTARFLAACDEADARRATHPVALPDGKLGRDIAALAMDQLRNRRTTSRAAEYVRRLEEELVKRDKTIAKLQRQAGEMRAQIQNAEIYAAV